jgi:hypothetical protein
MISVVVPSLSKYDDRNEDLVEQLRETAVGSELEILVQAYDQSFAKNVNEGLAKYSGDVVLVLNNDTTPLPGWSSWLLDNADMGIVSMTPRADCGWGFGMSREIQKAVGFLDEEFVNSYEDYDFFIRAACQGWNRVLADKPYFIHEGGLTIDKIWGKHEEQTPTRLRQCKTNREHMLKKWPGLDIDAVACTHWAVWGNKIMMEYGLGKIIE